MKDDLLEELKKKLEKNKEKLERELKGFAEKDKKLKGDWDTKYPKFDGGKMEEEADEVEEYSNLLPIENTLELELGKVNRALRKIEKGTYGICEKCKNPISEDRLKVYPRAVYCKKCRS